MLRRSAVFPAALVALALGSASCGTSSPADGVESHSGGRVIDVAASINAWGSILEQLGGTHVRATSIITNPNTDPHDYEPTPADGRTIATAKLFVENGIGYDSWAAKSVAASPDPGRTVLNVGKLVGVPDNGNPHRWYSPGNVTTVADAITGDLKKADPADAGYFDAQHRKFNASSLSTYDKLIKEIRARYAGTPVGASESIFAPLADALGLKLVTPPSFLKAISEGTDPSAADKSTIDSQISGKKIKVYVFNSQNSTPDVSAQINAAAKAGIPVTKVTETLSPKGTSFQDWQSAQLHALKSALHRATGK